MTVTEAMQAAIEAAVTAYGSPPADLVPEARIKGAGKHQNLTMPYIMHQPMTGTPIQTHGALAAVKRQYQAVIVGASLGSVENIALVLRAALGNAVTPNIQVILDYDGYMGYSDDTETHQWVFSWSILD